MGGLISTNLAEKRAEGITEFSYRQFAAKVSEMTGQHISPMGVWKVIQALGEQVCEEEKEITRAHKEGHICGEKEVPVLFEEADGAPWLKRVKDKSTIFQMDPFHKYQAIKENISAGKAQKAIRELLDAGQLDEMFEYITIYRDSLGDDKEIEKAQKLLEYFGSNKKGLRPYQKQIEKLPESPEGLEYLNMGTMENHVWSVIARRMKHNHTSWSKRGGNHLAKILAKKCSGKMKEVAERLQKPLFEEETVEEIWENILLSVKVPKKDGKGYYFYHIS